MGQPLNGGYHQRFPHTFSRPPRLPGQPQNRQSDILSTIKRITPLGYKRVNESTTSIVLVVNIPNTTFNLENLPLPLNLTIFLLHVILDYKPGRAVQYNGGLVIARKLQQI